MLDKLNKQDYLDITNSIDEIRNNSYKLCDMEDYIIKFIDNIENIIAIKTYAIYYQVGDEERKEEHYNAINIEQALGQFFIDHECLSYDNIIDHLEI